MNHKIITKGVSFNILDPDQEELLKHASKRSNFSSYIKRLIQRDIDNSFIPYQNNPISTSPDNDLDKDLMEGLI